MPRLLAKRTTEQQAILNRMSNAERREWHRQDCPLAVEKLAAVSDRLRLVVIPELRAPKAPKSPPMSFAERLELRFQRANAALKVARDWELHPTKGFRSYRKATA